MTGNRPSAPAPGLYTQPQERSTHGRSQGAVEEHSGARSTQDEWQQRLAEQCAAAVARRRQRKTDRDHHMGARTHGLRLRHHRKLARKETP